MKRLFGDHHAVVLRRLASPALPPGAGEPRPNTAARDAAVLKSGQPVANSGPVAVRPTSSKARAERPPRRRVRPWLFASGARRGRPSPPKVGGVRGGAPREERRARREAAHA